MDNWIFREIRTEYGCYGENEGAMKMLDDNWVAIEGEQYEDNRVNWLFALKTTISPNGDIAHSRFSNDESVQNFCKRLHAEVKGKVNNDIHCIMYGMEPKEICMIVGLFGFKEYSKKEIMQMCADKLQLRDGLSMSIAFMYQKASYKAYKNYVAALKDRK